MVKLYIFLKKFANMITGRLRIFQCERADANLSDMVHEPLFMNLACMQISTGLTEHYMYLWKLITLNLTSLHDTGTKLLFVCLSRPHNCGLEKYLSIMDRLVQAHNYFNKHNPTSLELTDVVCVLCILRFLQSLLMQIE